MATALNPNKIDFGLVLGLSAHVVYIWGQYGSFLVLLYILSCSCSAFVALFVCMGGKASAAVN